MQLQNYRSWEGIGTYKAWAMMGIGTGTRRASIWPHSNHARQASASPSSLPTCTPASFGCAFIASSAAKAPPPSTITRLFSGLRRARTHRAAQLCSHTCRMGHRKG